MRSNRDLKGIIARNLVRMNKKFIYIPRQPRLPKAKRWAGLLRGSLLTPGGTRRNYKFKQLLKFWF